MKLALNLFFSFIIFILLSISSFLINVVIFDFLNFSPVNDIIPIISIFLPSLIIVIFVFLKIKKLQKIEKSKKFVIFSMIICILFPIAIYNLFKESFEVRYMIGKPALYLYPERDMNIDIELSINGKITKDVPEYKNGWHVFVSKDGLIDNRYDYIYYENTLNQIILPDQGWVVSQQDLYKWFDEYLPKLGLNEKEKIQFKEYWLYKLLDYPYYEIKIFSEDFINKNMTLDINPKPDSVLRLIFNFKGLESYEKIENPRIDKFERKGFTVVEWGGRIEK